MSAETYRFKGQFKPIFDDLVVYKKICLQKNMTWENYFYSNRTSGICVNAKVKVGCSSVDNFMQTMFYLCHYQFNSTVHEKWIIQSFKMINALILLFFFFIVNLRDLKFKGYVLCFLFVGHEQRAMRLVHRSGTIRTVEFKIINYLTV
jgi:hypothetical protein